MSGPQGGYGGQAGGYGGYSAQPNTNTAGSGYGSAFGGGNTQPYQPPQSPVTDAKTYPQNNIGLPQMGGPMRGTPQPQGPLGGAGGNMTPQSSLYGPSGPPAGWVPDPTRQSGVRPWDSQIPGFDPTHFDPSAQQQPGAGYGFYRPPTTPQPPNNIGLPQTPENKPPLMQPPFQVPGGPGMAPPVNQPNRDPYAGMKGYNPLTGRFGG